MEVFVPIIFIILLSIYMFFLIKDPDFILDLLAGLKNGVVLQSRKSRIISNWIGAIIGLIFFLSVLIINLIGK